MKVEPTNNTAVLTDYVFEAISNKYTSGAVRSVGVNYSGFVDESFAISLFDDVDKLEKKKGSRLPLTPFGNNLVLPLS